MTTKVINWDGRHIPSELKGLPPGRYVIEPADEAPELTPEEEAGLRLGLDQLEAGEGKTLEEVLKELRRRTSHQ